MGYVSTLEVCQIPPFGHQILSSLFFLQMERSDSLLNGQSPKSPPSSFIFQDQALQECYVRFGCCSHWSGYPGNKRIYSVFYILTVEWWNHDHNKYSHSERGRMEILSGSLILGMGNICQTFVLWEFPSSSFSVTSDATLWKDLLLLSSLATSKWLLNMPSLGTAQLFFSLFPDNQGLKLFFCCFFPSS